MKQTKGSKPVAVDEHDSEEKKFDEEEDDGQEESQRPALNDIVSKFIRMLPRAIFDTPEIMGQRA